MSRGKIKSNDYNMREKKLYCKNYIVKIIIYLKNIIYLYYKYADITNSYFSYWIIKLC